MPTQVTNYQCPACTGPLHFAGGSGKLECEYCGASYDVAEIEALYAEKEEKAAAARQAAEEAGQSVPSPDGNAWDTSSLSEDWGAEGDGMRAYSCPSCGAELICDETTAATSCPYCGNPTVVPGQFSGQLRPDFIIPFKLNKEDAVKALKKHYKGKIFLPKRFTLENHCPSALHWKTMCRRSRGSMSPSGCLTARRRATPIMKLPAPIHTAPATMRSPRPNTTTSTGPVASSKMPDDHMDSIEPYDYQELKPFSTAYLPGFLADKFDVTVEQCRQRADQRCEGTLSSALRNTVTGYHTCTLIHDSVNLKRGKVHYALMPVWMLNTKWKGKDFLFAMNGQTGKLVGDLPVSWGRFWSLFAAIVAPLSVLGTVLAVFVVL